MKLFIFSAFLLVSCFHATQAVRCMQGFEVVGGNEQKQDKTLEFTECDFGVAAISATKLALIKPSNIALPTTAYKCFHLRYEETKTNSATILKGCIYKNQDVCDGKFQTNSVREAFCSQCEQDECNSAMRFAFDWKILGLTIFALASYFMNVSVTYTFSG